MILKSDDTPDVLANRVDLEEINGDILLFGGPYSNFQATEAVFAQADKLGLPASNIICTGDVCAYCADPVATTRLVMERGCTVVAGNCEDSLGHRKPDCGCNFDEGTACDIASGEWFRHADTQLDDEARAWMLARPTLVTFTNGGRKYAVIHAAASAINTFLWPVVGDTRLAAEIALVEAETGPLNAVIAGHTGMAMVRDVATLSGDGRTVRWVNAGAVGLPAHKGDQRTSYVVLEDGDFRIEKLTYDYAAAARAMREAGFKARYHYALESGWWPSEDTFPPEMRIGREA